MAVLVMITMTLPITHHHGMMPLHEDAMRKGYLLDLTSRTYDSLAYELPECCWAVVVPASVTRSLRAVTRRNHHAQSRAGGRKCFVYSSSV